MTGTSQPVDKSGTGVRPRKPGEVNLPGIERDAVILAALFTVASLALGSRRVTAGVAVGGLLALLNWVWLRRFAQGVFLRREGGANRLGGLLYASKYLFTFGAVYLLLRYDQINVFALLAGLLVVIMAIALEGVRKTLDLNKEDAQDGDAP
jgi:hypothetical protein